MKRLLVLVALILLEAGCRSRPETPIAEPLAQFDQGVSEYMKVRDHLADSLGSVDETRSQAEIAARSAALAAAITTARTSATQGQIFTPEASVVIATMIKDEYRRRSDSLTESRQEHANEFREDGLPPFVPQVNQIFPTTYPLPTFDALLLPLLPKLPEHLEYRRVENFLLIRDSEANLIVDYMPDAFPN